MKIILNLVLAATLLSAWPGQAPAATATLSVDDGGRIDFSAYRGKVVYLDFWASWCEPCRQSFAWMNRLREVYPDDELVIIAVNLDTDRRQASAFLDRVPASFDIAYDPEGATAAAYELQGMPSSFLIDKDGRITRTTVGFRHSETEKLENLIRRLVD